MAVDVILSALYDKKHFNANVVLSYRLERITSTYRVSSHCVAERAKVV